MLDYSDDREETVHSTTGLKKGDGRSPINQINA